ncbi:hypothetical protein MLD38_021368 [Melastoma candidum]|uniref:Uncharacterized protein n=1 Tax=Melastoma candidum TaxID=119954 RepID=A0ACB9QH37_9MYRT|nr:hypothetical protein MLD38_021368 [Melastoma candidum]
MFVLHRHGEVFTLFLTGTIPDDEHHLSPAIIASLLSCLRQATSLSTSGSVLITTASGKFFCNGFDLKYARSTPSPSRQVEKMVDSVKDVVVALLNLPMLTIAAVNGHASGAGLVLALLHDYVIVNGCHGYMYMSEIDLGLRLPDFAIAILREKVGSERRRGLRELVLWGRRMKGEEALALGVVDEALMEGGEEEIQRRAKEMAMELGKKNWDGRVYAELRKGLFKEVWVVLGLERTAAVVAGTQMVSRCRI